MLTGILRNITLVSYFPLTPLYIYDEKKLCLLTSTKWNTTPYCATPLYYIYIYYSNLVQLFCTIRIYYIKDKPRMIARIIYFKRFIVFTCEKCYA